MKKKKKTEKDHFWEECNWSNSKLGNYIIVIIDNSVDYFSK